ncbi:MAG TPA: GTPase Era [Alphaproteobacteria bacterium]|nr:GTPase Era [Alphaproteobacteria bacterium]HAJ47433.1 GTPase Era [Alphaproteobacteria bacterium]
MTQTQTQTVCGFAAILGAPNAGKSTLVNQLVGQKISIVSRKVQTTRMRVRGIMVVGGAQVVLVDTPGIFAPKRRLDRAMVAAAWGSAADADAIVVLADAEELVRAPDGYAAQDTARIIEGLKAQKLKASLALNKIDEIARPHLLPLAERFQHEAVFDQIFMISGLKGYGVEQLRTHLVKQMPEGPWAYPEDEVADIPERALAAEITREHLFDRLHEELPYASTVETDQWTEFKDGSVRIDQTIYVAREGQKGIVLGKGGVMVKEIGARARTEMEGLFERRIHLFLHVKVRENWAEDPALYRRMGLDFDAKE